MFNPMDQLNSLFAKAPGLVQSLMSQLRNEPNGVPAGGRRVTTLPLPNAQQAAEMQEMAQRQAAYQQLQMNQARQVNTPAMLDSLRRMGLPYK